MGHQKPTPGAEGQLEVNFADGSVEQFDDRDAAQSAMGELGDQLVDLESGEVLEEM